MINSMPTRVLAGVTVPDSDLVRRAFTFAQAQSEPYLFNHVVRSWLFAVLAAEEQGGEYDAEVVAIAILLHDLGLMPDFSGPERFEIVAANAARAFVKDSNVDERRTQLIWDGVALNSTPSICLYKEREVALCGVGIGLDYAGFGYDRVSLSTMAEILTAFPRLDMKKNFAQSVCRIVRTKPETTYDNFAADFGERFVPGYTRSTFVDVLENAPFTE
jgi:hypothetical protein